MTKNKTQPTTMTASAFLNAIDDEDRRRDCKTSPSFSRKSLASVP